MQRRIFDHDDYIQALNRQNVHLTNDPIVAFHERSVLTKSGAQYPVDVVVRFVYSNTSISASD